MKRSSIIKIVVGSLVFLVCVCLLLGGLPEKTEFQLKQREPQSPANPLPPAVSTAPATEPVTQPPTEMPTEPPTEPATEPFQMPEITWKKYPENQSITAKRAFVYDCQTGEYLFTRGDPQEKLYIASITKAFAIDTAAATMDPKEDVKAASGFMSYLPASASLAGIQSGEILTVEQLYGSILLPSGNDAAYVLAIATGRKLAGDPTLPVSQAVDTFVAEMNRRTEALGLVNTHFENPVGFHSESHYTCFDDLVTISLRTLENDAVMQYTVLPKATIKPVSGREKALQNTNALVNPNSEYYCPYAVGLKTGHTIAAEYCLLAAFDIEGHRYIVGTFGCPGYNGRYNDALLLFNRYVIGQ